MAVTPGGTPYVESSDLVANYPAVSLALAEHIDDIGVILQVVSTTKTDTFTTTSTSFTDITGLTATITPSSATNKIFVIATTTGCQNIGANSLDLRLVRDATAIAIGDAAGSRIRATVRMNSAAANHQESSSMSTLDSPATTSAITYAVQAQATGGSSVVINRSFSDADTTSIPRTVSTITVIEVSA
jgi:hypothetical protein